MPVGTLEFSQQFVESLSPEAGRVLGWFLAQAVEPKMTVRSGQAIYHLDHPDFVPEWSGKYTLHFIMTRLPEETNRVVVISHVSYWDTRNQHVVVRYYEADDFREQIAGEPVPVTEVLDSELFPN